MEDRGHAAHASFFSARNHAVYSPAIIPRDGHASATATHLGRHSDHQPVTSSADVVHASFVPERGLRSSRSPSSHDYQHQQQQRTHSASPTNNRTTIAVAPSIWISVDVSALVSIAVSDLDVVCCVVRPVGDTAPYGRVANTAALQQHEDAEVIAVAPVLSLANSGGRTLNSQPCVLKGLWQPRAAQLPVRNTSMGSYDRYELAVEMRYGHFPEGTSTVIAEGRVPTSVVLLGDHSGTMRIAMHRCDRRSPRSKYAPENAGVSEGVVLRWERSNTAGPSYYSDTGAGVAEYRPSPRSIDVQFLSQRAGAAFHSGNHAGVTTASEVDALARRLADAEEEIARLRREHPQQQHSRHPPQYPHRTFEPALSARSGYASHSPRASTTLGLADGGHRTAAHHHRSTLDALLARDEEDLHSAGGRSGHRSSGSNGVWESRLDRQSRRFADPYSGLLHDAHQPRR
jgi:hypothetical protein